MQCLYVLLTKYEIVRTKYDRNQDTIETQADSLHKKIDFTS